MTLDRTRAWLATNYFALALACFWLAFLLLPSAKAVNDIFYAMVALPGLFVVGRRWRELPWRNAGFLLFVLWLAYGALSGMAWGPGGFDRSKDLLYVFLFYGVMILAVDTSFWRSELLRRLAFWLALSYVLLSCIYLWLSGAFPFGERLMFFPARISNPIHASMLLVSLWALAIGDWLARKRYAELVPATVLMLFCIVQGLQSRSGLFGFAAVLVFLLLRWRPVTTLAILAGVAVLGAAYLGLTGGAEMLQSWSFVARADSGRFELWGKVLSEMGDCGWLLGCGYGHAIQATLSATPDTPIAHSHNIFVAQALLGGVIGLCLLAAMLLCSLLGGWRRNAPWALCLAAGAIMLNFDGNRLIDNPDELWLLFHWPLAVLIALNARRPHAKPAEADQTAAASLRDRCPPGCTR